MPWPPEATRFLDLVPQYPLPVFDPDREPLRGKVGRRFGRVLGYSHPIGFFFDEFHPRVSFPGRFIVSVAHAQEAVAVFLGQAFGSILTGLQCRLGAHVPFSLKSKPTEPRQ